MDERVTLIILSHNNFEGLQRSVESAIKQTYPDIQTIVTGPRIADDTRDYLHGYGIIYIESKSPDFVPAICRTINAACVTGKLIALLNEGDIFSPKKIEAQVKAFGSRSDIGLVFTAYQMLNDDGKPRNTIYLPEFTRHSTMSVLLNGHVLNSSTAMVRRECRQCLGNLATELDLWVNIANHCKVRGINIPLVGCIQPSGRSIQASVSNALDVITPEELLPAILSQPEDLSGLFVHIIKGAILMRYRLHRSAMDSLDQAYKLCPDDPLYLVWMGMLLLQVKDYKTALDYLAKVPEGDRLYLDAQWMSILAREVLDASDGIQDRIDIEVGKQYNGLLDTTLDIVDGLNPDEKKLDVAIEVSQYLNWDISQALKALFYGGSMIADEWNQKSPPTAEEITDFYRQTENYIFDLAGWHREPTRKKLAETAIKICKQNKTQKILDFGCGIGQDGISFSEAGFDVALADLPGKTFDFAKWRIEKGSLSIKTINVDELDEMYDAILCFDVLEHLWEPEKTLRYLHDHLSDEGIMLITASFGHDEIHPMHLERNVRYLGVEFVKMMERVGFMMEKRYRMPLVFRKI